MVSTLFYLTRHAEHGHVGRILTGRMPGAPLSSHGKAQAAALGHKMSGKRLDLLLSSPQMRTRETAEAIAAETGCPMCVSPELDEIDFGAWSGSAFEALAADPAWRRWNAFRDSASTPAGETMAGVAARLTGLIERLCREFPGGSVCLVSHADVIKAALCHYRGEPFQQVHAFEIAPASMSTVAVDRHGGRVLAVNELSWRRDATTGDAKMEKIAMGDAEVIQ